jgi:hypothetical protein
MKTPPAGVRYAVSVLSHGVTLVAPLEVENSENPGATTPARVARLRETP